MAPAAPDDPARRPIDRETAIALVAMALAVFIIGNDFTALGVALPPIESEFDSDVSTVQWVINAYAVIFGVLIVTGGRLADMIGRRRAFFIGAAIFAAFSLLAGLAPGTDWLIAARALMGVGGALMWPAVLGMTYAIIPADRAGLAGGLIIGAAGFSNAAGPLIGGAITEALDWRWIFFLNLPIALAAALVTWKTVPESSADDPDRRLDYAGSLTLSVGLIALLVALDQAGDDGFGDPLVLGLLALCVAMLALFSVVERRGGTGALVPPDVRSNRPFVTACAVVLLMSPIFFVSLMYLPQLFQKSLGFSALESGLALLPMMLTFTVTSLVAGTLYERIGPRPVLVSGAAALTVGPLLISLTERGDSWAQAIPGMAVTGLGVGLFYSAVTTWAVTALDPSRSALAGGITYMCQIAGGSIGLGIATLVFSTASSDELSEEVASAGPPLSGSEQDALTGLLAGTESSAEVVARYPQAAGRLEDLARDAFASGFTWCFRYVAALALVGLVITVAAVGRGADADGEG